MSNSIAQEPEELQTETRNTVSEKYEKTMPEVKRRELLRYMKEETIKLIKDKLDTKEKCNKSSIRILKSVSNDCQEKIKRTIIIINEKR